jgi:hypothetical protein
MNANIYVPHDKMYWRTFFQDVKHFTGFYDDNDTRDWVKPREEILKYIHQNLSDNIPVGTKLYHGTLDKNFMTSLQTFKDKNTFLGLEPSISMWYTSELANILKNTTVGYVYEFEVLKPIKVDYVIPYMSIHPFSNSKQTKTHKCKYGGVCIHPQVVFHFDNEPPYDISIEVVLPLKVLYNNGYIKLSKIYNTDMYNLLEHKSYTSNDLRIIAKNNFLLFQKK